MRTWQWIFVSLGVLLFSPSVRGQGAGDLHLEAAEKVLLCRERDSTLRPFFRVALNIKDRDGKIQGIKMDDQTLLGQIKVQGVEGTSQAREKFEVLIAQNRAENGQTVMTAAPGRTILLLFDISGSMVEKKNWIGGKPRLEVAKDAARVMLDNFRDDIDRIAIVPFESRNVQKRIMEETQFVTSKAAALSQINKLSQSDVAKANTALYSATAWALDQLLKLPGEGRMLVVLTDGKNDVHPEKGDDPGLWGEEGLEKVKEKAKQSNIPIWTIGFGIAGQDFNPDALQQMVYPQPNKQYFPAQNAEQIKDVLKTAEESLSNRLIVTFFPSAICNYRNLSKLDFKVLLPISPGQVASGTLSWSPNSASGIAFEGNLQGKELDAALGNTRLQSTCGTVEPWKQFLRTFGLLALFSGGFALLWFLPPRLLWPRLNVPQVPSKLKLPGRLSQKKAPTPIPPKPRPSSAAAQVPAKPRQRFEETRIFDDRDLKS